MEMTDELLWKYAPQEEQYLLEHIPLTPDPLHVFSKRFERKMKVLIRRERRSPFMKSFVLQSKRAAVFLLASALIAFTAIMSVEALRVRFFRMVQEIYEKYSTISYEPVGENSVASQTFVEYEPTYIPDGFQLVRERVYSHSKHMTFRNSQSGGFLFMQSFLDVATVDFDTEHVSLEPIQINGMDGYYLPNPSLKSIFWDDGVYYFEVSGYLDKKELLKIAESINIKK